MNKATKMLGITLGAILGLAVIVFGVMILIGPSDVVVLTDEQVEKSNAEQKKLYSNLDLTGFNTVTVAGENVTSECFKEYKVTMVNLWTTNCSPCIAEMPDLAKLYDNRPEGSNIISICVDATNDKSAVKFAAEVMLDSGAKFMTLIPDESLQTSLTNRTTIFPTTIFVDSNGKTVGEPHFGGRSEEAYRQAILDRIGIVEKTKTAQ